MIAGCIPCGAPASHRGWCRICGRSYAGPTDFYEETKNLPPGQRINRSVEMFDKPEPPPRRRGILRWLT